MSLAQSRNSQSKTSDKNTQQPEIKALKRSLTNKNRQICTLNRIITNLRKQLGQLTNSISSKEQVIHVLKKNVNELKETIRNKQIKEIQLLKKEEELLEKLFKANEQLQKREEQNQKEIFRQRSQNQSKLQYFENIKIKCQELQRENHRLGAELQLRSEAENKIRESRQSKFSTRQMSLQAFNHKPQNYRNRAQQNPFQGFLKPQYQQAFLQLSRFTHRTGEKAEDNTWCRIDELMSQNFSPGANSSRMGKSRLYTEEKIFKNKSEIDAESAIQMIRQENERIKVSLR